MNKVSSLAVRSYNLDELIPWSCAHNHLPHAGLPNGGSPGDGVLLSERRTGKKNKWQKYPTKLLDGNYETMSSGKENVEMGVSRIEDRLKEQVKTEEHGYGSKFAVLLLLKDCYFSFILFFKYSMLMFILLLHCVKKNI